MAENNTFYPEFSTLNTFNAEFDKTASFQPEFIEITRSFQPEFKEISTLYRGVVRVWIGDGTTGTAGVLYAEYVDGRVQELGYVSDYNEAKASMAQQGIDLTYAQWVEMLLAVPSNAITAQNAANDASDSKAAAERWATGGSGGTATTTNNAKYYATQAKSSADSVKGATAVLHYQNSDSYSTIPTGTWSETPSPQGGKYTWTRTTLTWTDSSVSYIYNVSYSGLNGSGAVHSINSKIGDVTLYATDIPMSSTDSTTVASMLTLATNADIDALFQ